jgi:hypothetical protein
MVTVVFSIFSTYPWEELHRNCPPTTGMSCAYEAHHVAEVPCRSLSSNEHAWLAAQGHTDIRHCRFPSDDMVWSTVATQHATTWHHIDDYGLATVVEVRVGAKYWVVCSPRRHGKSDKGIPGSIHAFDDDDEQDVIWDHEGVLLQAGDVL